MDTGQYNELLTQLQHGLPLEPRPFAVLGEKLGIAEDEIVGQVAEWLDKGQARRLGAVFDARRLGYLSTLCAVDAGNNIDEAAIPFVQHPGVTHCYQRSWPEELDPTLPENPDGNPPNLWFTLAVPAEVFDAELSHIENTVGPYPFASLPAIKRFKIDVIFDFQSQQQRESIAIPQSTVHGPQSILSDQEKDLVKLLDDNLPLVNNPYEMVASKADISTRELIQTLLKWKDEGVLRRVALILRHHSVGFKANAMCVWSVPEDRITEAGRRLAQNPEVTHCYQREVSDLFPYNLFAMIHTDKYENTVELCRRIAESANLENGKMLFSLKEYKKTSMKYFRQ